MIRLFDAHADTPYELWIRKEPFEKNSCHIDGEKAAAFSRYEQIFAFCSLAGTKWALSEEDFEQCFSSFVDTIQEQSSVQPYYSIEGAEIIECDPNKLDSLAHKGFVSSTLTWNADNALAGWHRSERGLTQQGRDYVAAAKEAGILIDVSHVSETAFWDLLRITQAPILASHCNCRAIWEHSRNLTDDQLRAVAETGGAVGLNLYSDFIGDPANFETMRRHLEHMLRLCGEQHVCLGGDLDGCESLPEGFHDLTGYIGFYHYLQSVGYGDQLLDQVYYLNLKHLIGR